MSVQDRSVIDLVDTVLRAAIDVNASDIHLEPTKQSIRVRFRIDGVLIDQTPLLFDLYIQVVARIKVLAHMNSTQKRTPQDGKCSLVHKGKSIDLRVSTFPCVWGETVVIRILDAEIHAIKLENLGFEPKMLDLFKTIIKKTHGFFLVTGPTGSGKTTTLYAALDLLHRPESNIVTLEDPVEYSLEGITQAQIYPDVGFTFQDGMRSMLRQDPDIIMIGEIRDKETARTAIEAAMTGHMVLSTLHTNDAPSAIIRLMDMGIEPYLLNASLTGVLAQRLVRRLCNVCKIAKKPSESDSVMLAKISVVADILYYPVGCIECQNIGYKNRIGIFELLPISEELRSFIVHNPLIGQFYEQAQSDGMVSLLSDGLVKLLRGDISLDEFARVLL